MSMFDNYSNLDIEYTPNNLKCNAYKQVFTHDDSLPHKEYNKKGEFIGYSWCQGDTLTFDFSVDKYLYVQEDSIIFEQPGEAPTTETVGAYLQKAYNVTDMNSWTCVSLGQTVYKWKKDRKFTYITGCKRINILNPDFSESCNITFNVYNFRNELMYTTDANGRQVSINIGGDLAKMLIPGLYYFEFVCSENDTTRKCEEFTILIK